MTGEQLTASQSLAVLRENASRLASLIRGLPPKRSRTAPAPDEWSPNDVLAHIRACCDVWGGNIGRILTEEHPTIAGMNPRTWMKRTDYPDWPFERALRAFMRERKTLLRTLDALPPHGWERAGTVTAYGQSNERTVRSYASALAKHERTHVRQIERAVVPKARM